MPTFTVFKGNDAGKPKKSTTTKPDELVGDNVLVKVTASGVCGTGMLTTQWHQRVSWLTLTDLVLLQTCTLLVPPFHSTRTRAHDELPTRNSLSTQSTLS